LIETLEKNRPKSNLLSVVVPFGNINIDLNRFQKWILQAVENEIQVIIVVDLIDQSIFPYQFFSDIDSHFLQIENVNLASPGLSRQHGLQFAKGSWVAFWDADDEPNVLKILSTVERVDSTSMNVVIGRYINRNVTSGEMVTSTRFTQNMHRNIVSMSLNPGLWRFIFRRSEIQQMRFSSFPMGEDQLFIQNFGLGDRDIFFTNSILYNYLTGISGSLTSNDTSLQKIEMVIPKFRESRIYATRINILISQIMELRLSITYLRKVWLNSDNRICGCVVRCLLLSPLLLFRVLFFLITKNKVEGKVDLGNTSVLLNGGLGNQLFQLAAALHVAPGETVTLEQSFGRPRLNSEGLPEICSMTLPNRVELSDRREIGVIAQKIINFAIRLGAKERRTRVLVDLYQFLVNFYFCIFERNVSKIWISNGIGFDSSLGSRQSGKLLIGYFQTYHYSTNASVSAELRALKVPKESMEYSRLSKVVGMSNVLIVHIRLGDYKNENSFGIPSATYYVEALRIHLETNSFDYVWLFSDEVDLARKMLSVVKDNVITYMDDKTISVTETFQLMRAGKAFIIANSTFSWWAAFLADKESVSVICPQPWFRSGETPNGLIPKHWAKSPARYSKGIL
jgi:hypothetical protein